LTDSAGNIVLLILHPLLLVSTPELRRTFILPTRLE
jgi:hypothetical protein